MNQSFWFDKRIFLTGHTGFKGGWLALWLSELGAKVSGYALAPPTNPNFYSLTKLEDRLCYSVIADIRDLSALVESMKIAKPDIVFHLAAQPLVRHSYAEPLETYAVNVMGTVNLLEAVRRTPEVRAVVNVTTDKCYENKEWVWPYRENEALGGSDPYSSSKACSELVTAAYRRSFFEDSAVGLASARAGNVIGGGDWAADRLVPDFLRSYDAGEKLTLRMPHATRPWQHVLEPLAGYLTLAEKLFDDGKQFSEAWNFGPEDVDTMCVQQVVDILGGNISDAAWVSKPPSSKHESSTLKLDSSKSKNRLGWYPRWNLNTALNKTLHWHNEWREGKNMADFSLEQIEEYKAEGRLI